MTYQPVHPRNVAEAGVGALKQPDVPEIKFLEDHPRLKTGLRIGIGAAAVLGGGALAVTGAGVPVLIGVGIAALGIGNVGLGIKEAIK